MWLCISTIACFNTKNIITILIRGSKVRILQKREIIFDDKIWNFGEIQNVEYKHKDLVDEIISEINCDTD